MPRLFTGVEIPADVGQALGMLRGGLPGARWIDPENYHLTLRFIGDVDDVIAHEVASLLGRVKRGAFDLYLEGLTSFGGRKPRAVVASVAQAQALLDVQAEHERLLQRIGLEPEGRKYTAARDAGALARFVEPRRRRISFGARLFPYWRRSACRVSCCFRRAPRSAADLTWSKRAIRSTNLTLGAISAGRNRRDCTSKIAVATPWPSAMASRISESMVERGGSTSPTTLPKSN